MGELHLWKPSYLHPHHHPAIPFMIDIPFPEKMKHPFQATPRISSSLITMNQPFSVGHPLINYYPCCIMFDKSFVINEWIFHKPTIFWGYPQLWKPTIAADLPQIPRLPRIWTWPRRWSPRDGNSRSRNDDFKTLKLGAERMERNGEMVISW